MASLSAIEEVAKSVASKYLRPYIDRGDAVALQNRSPKQIHDRVWGTIVLTPLEVVLIDSPLIQRLRYLRQLGVAQWVYPTAAHTRFEHSLGVLHQTQQLIGAINQSAENKYGKQIINSDLTVVLRAAALLHDVGHPVLSHVSEYSLEVDPNTLLELQRERRKYGEDAKLSEIIAALVVRSDEFQALIKKIFDAHVKLHLSTSTWAGRIPEFVDKVSKCILGQSISEEIPLLHQLISGPFDADKLDYMVRDASMAGIPGIIDISRLVQKVMVKKVAPTDLPARLAATIRSGIPEVYLIGFPWSGLSVVDELLLTKMILFSKLYQHPKVVAIEAMIWAVIHSLSKIVDNKTLISFVYDVFDDELILADAPVLRRRLGLQSAGESYDVDVAIDNCADILSRIRDRNLFVRAFAFSAHNPSGVDANSDSTTSAMVELVKMLSDRAALSDFHEEIVLEVSNLTRHLGHNITEESIRSMVVIRKKLLPSQEELRRAYIFPTQGKPKTFGETGIHKDAWSSSFVSAAPKGYIFAPRELAAYVFIGTEAVIAARYGVAVPEWLMEEAKQSSENIREIKLRLREAGYYRGKARCIRPMLDRLKMSDVEQTVSSFADRFSAIQSSMPELVEREGLKGGNTAMRQRAEAWLDQFDPQYIECALRILERSRLLGRQDVVAMMRQFLQNEPEFEGASVVGLSQGNESSQIIQYYVADVPGNLKFYSSLPDAARAGRDAPVIFVDDFCASGGQLTNLLGSWFGNANLKKAGMHEQRDLALEPERDFLRTRKLAFCFVAAWKGGLQSVEIALKELGLQGTLYAHLDDDNIPFAFDERYDDLDSLSSFRGYCKGLGRQLLGKEGWSAEKLEERVLGYGNRGLLLFFPYNAPAQSLVNMWASGKVDGDDWQPLIPRRKKTI